MLATGTRPNLLWAGMQQSAPAPHSWIRSSVVVSPSQQPGRHSEAALYRPVNSQNSSLCKSKQCPDLRKSSIEMQVWNQGTLTCWTKGVNMWHAGPQWKGVGVGMPHTPTWATPMHWLPTQTAVGVVAAAANVPPHWNKPAEPICCLQLKYCLVCAQL